MHQHPVVAADVHAVEARDDFADNTPVGVTTDEGVGEGVVEGQLRRQILHSRVEAVVTRRVAVEGDVREVVGAEDVRHVWLHRLLYALDIEGTELLVSLFDVGDTPILPSAPGEECVVLAPAHAPIEEEAAAHKIVVVDFHRRLDVQKMDIGRIGGLVACLLQRLLEGPSPELVVAKRRHHGESRGEQTAEEGVKAADKWRGQGVARHYSHVGLRVLNQIADALQKRREMLLVHHVNDVIHPLMQVGKAENLHLSQPPFAVLICFGPKRWQIIVSVHEDCGNRFNQEQSCPIDKLIILIPTKTFATFR